MHRFFTFLLLGVVLLANRSFAAGASLDDTISDLSHRWAKASYQTPAQQQERALRDLVASAEQAAQTYPDRAEPLIWQAIALASAAKLEGGLGGLAKVKLARELLLTAEKRNPSALAGSIYCTLGSLYAKVPGWPIGYGDKARAKQYLDMALAVNPDGIDPHFFYAELLADQSDYASAADHLERALAAPARAGREDSDAGRRTEARQLLDDLRRKQGGKLAGHPSPIGSAQ